MLRPKQLVLATGMSSQPNLLDLPGTDEFAGEQHHSSKHPGPDGYVGKKAVVIGSNNSAHDICAALWEAGVDVTMVQRSSTHIVRSSTLMDIGLGALYSEEAVANGITTEKADMIFASLPYRILHEFQIPLYDQMRERDADFYARLEAAGFDLDWGEDGSGLFMKYLRRGSGYYIDVGASELVANGDIKLVNGQVARLTADAVVMEDGTTVPADVVVYATGYKSMNGWAAELISQEVADKRRQGLGAGLGHEEGPGPVGGRAAQHVEADAAGGAVVPRRQPAPVAPLLALPRAAAEGAAGGARHAGLRTPGGAPSRVGCPLAVAVRHQVMHYALLIYERPANYEGLSDDERRAMTAEYMAVGEQSVGSAHLQPTSMATTVRVADGETLVTDGPFAETKDVFGGYYVIEADDLDARDRARRAGAGGALRRLRRDPPRAGVPALNSARSGAASSRSSSASSATSTSPRRPSRRRSWPRRSAGRATASRKTRARGW